MTNPLRILGITRTGREVERSMFEVVELASALLMWARALTLCCVVFALGLGSVFTFSPMRRLGAPAFQILRATPGGGIRLWGVLLLTYGVFLFTVHRRRHLWVLRISLVVGMFPYLLLGLALFVGASMDPRGAFPGVVTYLVIGAVHLVCSGMVIPPERGTT